MPCRLQPALCCWGTTVGLASPRAVFTSTWLGSLTIGTGEYIIKRVPLVQHIYSAAKQVGDREELRRGGTHQEALVLLVQQMP